MKQFAVFLLIVCVYGIGGVRADDHEGGQIARGWIFVPRGGAQLEFRQAFKEHSQWRHDQGDPWSWNVYVQLDGSRPGAYHVWSFGHKWSDFDAYDASEFASKASQHWFENVAPHVAQTRGVITEHKADLSHWPEAGSDFTLFAVLENRLKIGEMWNHMQALKTIGEALKEAEWGESWIIHEVKSGGYVPSVTMVLPGRNWADMADPDPDVYQAALGVLGEEETQKAFQRYNNSIQESVSYMVRMLPKLHVEGEAGE